jgi:hypothetical protein
MNENAEGNRMIREIQRQQNEKMRQQIKEKLRKDLNAIGTNMIHDIQRQKIKDKLRNDLNAIGSNMIRDIQAQQKLARQLMQAETRKRIKPAPSRRQLTRKANPGPVFRGYNGLLGEHLTQKQNNSKPFRPKVVGLVNRGYNAVLNNHLDKKQARNEVRRRISAILTRPKQNGSKTKTKKKYTV